MNASSEIKSIPKSNPPITNRECTILKLVADGLTSDEIAAQLFIARETVKTHRKNMILKFKVNNTAALIRMAFDREILIPNRH